MKQTIHKRNLAGRRRRQMRVRSKVQGTPEQPRLSVFRSSKHIYAQVIDDVSGKTLAAFSTRNQSVDKAGKKLELAKKVGAGLAEVCKEKNIDQVVFDRNGYRYHGRVKAVAEGAREGGLQF